MNYRILGLVLGLLFAPLLIKAQPVVTNADTASAWTPGSRVHVAASGGVCAHQIVTYTGACGTLVPVGTRGTVIGGPRTDSGWNFWAVQWDNSVLGWSRQANLAVDSLAAVACNCTTTPPVTPPPPPPPPPPTPASLYNWGNGVNYY